MRPEWSPVPEVSAALAPEVTVITATYNRAALLERAIRSVLAQTLSRFEYLIVDDGSTDDSGDRIRPYLGDARLRYLSQPNGGQSSALNLGLQAARAPWVAFLDSDDELEPDHLDYLLSQAREHPGVDLVVGGFAVVGRDPAHCFVVDYFDPSRRISLAEVEVVLGTLLVRTERALAVGGFRGILSDIDLVQRLRAAGCRYTRAPRPTLRYHFGEAEDSMSVRYLVDGDDLRRE
jgi:glycosyltransferase involved in cell wall biosynthesis